MKKMISALLIAATVLSFSTPIFAADESLSVSALESGVTSEAYLNDSERSSDPTDADPSLDRPEFPIIRGAEYYWSNSRIDESTFNKYFYVSNTTHRYGKALFSNSGTVEVTIRIYDPKGQLVAQNFAQPNSNATLNFGVYNATGSYNITISNGGVQGIKGILSVATSDQPF